jgi:hypothetical protein
MWRYFRDCNVVCHNTAFFTKLDAFDRRYSVYGFYRPDPILGYALADGTFKMREPAWNGATITIRHGVRVNPNFEPTSTDGAILAVGASFVFGEQVSDDETWPALLERELSRRVVNGGVSGYGPVQALLRAEQLLKLQDYSLIILSILVGIEPWRDRWVHVGPYRLPAVIRDHGRIRVASIEENARIQNFFCVHRWIPELFFWSHVAKRFFSRFVGYDGRCASISHPKAATVDEVVEFAVERLAALPVRQIILLQYPRFAFDTGVAARLIDEARKIRDAADRHGLPVIDTYHAIEDNALSETYIYSDSYFSHHSKSGNDVVADLIVREIASRHLERQSDDYSEHGLQHGLQRGQP